MKFTVATAVSLLALTITSHAADAVVEEKVSVAVMDQAFSWSGFYLGAQAGYAWGDGSITGESGDNSDPDVDGFLGGVYGGYNYQFENNAVIGFDADFAWSGADGTAQTFDADGTPYPGSDTWMELAWSASARARLGYAFDRFLPYVAGGVAFGDVDYGADNNGFELFDRNDSFVGYTVGAGMEYAFAEKIVGRLEYRFTDFGSEDDAADPDTGIEPIEIELKAHDIRLGLSYKF